MAHLSVRLLVALSTVKTWGADVRFMPEAKLCDMTILSVGWSKYCHRKLATEFLSTRLPLLEGDDGAGRPEHSTGAVEQLQVADGRQAERAPRVDGRAVARGPDGDAAGLGDRGNEERQRARGRRRGQE